MKVSGKSMRQVVRCKQDEQACRREAQANSTPAHTSLHGCGCMRWFLSAGADGNSLQHKAGCTSLQYTQCVCCCAMQALTEIVYVTAQVVLYTVITYFMVGFRLEASRFFYVLLLTWLNCVVNFLTSQVRVHTTH